MAKNDLDAVIVAAGRSAIGRANKGSLVKVRPDDLASIVTAEVVRRSKADPKEIEDVIFGCAMTEGEQGMNLARQISLLADLPVTPGATTVNRFCGSSLQAVNMAAQAIMTGTGDVHVAGGVESMSSVPMGGFQPMKSFNPRIIEMSKNKPQAVMMPQTAQYVSEAYKISKEEQDRFALESHKKAIAAISAGYFKDQIVPVEAEKLDGSRFIFEVDECPRKDTTLEKIASMAPIVQPVTDESKPATITAANSCPINDGAAAVVMMSRKRARELNLQTLAVVRGMAVAGVEPYEMGIGPSKAVPKALARSGLKLSDIDLIELNEAFAAQVLACVKLLGIDVKRLNVNGGAIALGHPLGATGAILTTRLLHELGRRKAKYGVVTMCIGGGQGIATVFERE